MSGLGGRGRSGGASGGDLGINGGQVESGGAGAEGFGLCGGEGLAEAEAAQGVDIGFDAEGGGGDEVGGGLAVDGDDLGAEFFDASENAGGLLGKFPGGDEGDAHRASCPTIVRQSQSVGDLPANPAAAPAGARVVVFQRRVKSGGSRR